MSISNKIGDEKVKDVRTKTLGAIADLLASKNIDIDEVGDIKRISIYQSMLKVERLLDPSKVCAVAELDESNDFAAVFDASNS